MVLTATTTGKRCKMAITCYINFREKINSRCFSKKLRSLLIIVKETLPTWNKWKPDSILDILENRIQVESSVFIFLFYCLLFLFIWHCLIFVGILFIFDIWERFRFQIPAAIAYLCSRWCNQIQGNRPMTSFCEFNEFAASSEIQSLVLKIHREQSMLYDIHKSGSDSQ